MEQVEAIPATQLNELALSAIIANAVRAAKAFEVGGCSHLKWELYGASKKRIEKLNPTPDEYERAIKMLADALKI